MPRAHGPAAVLFAALAAAGVCAPTAHGQPAGGPGAAPLDWKSLESPLLTRHVQLTSRNDFVRAGEAYFSPDSRWIIFQATPAPGPGRDADPFYAMYAAELVRDAAGRITGMNPPVRLSAPGTANTCGYFHPTSWTADSRYDFLFGSTLVRPSDQQKSGFQVDQRDYRWMFPQEMEIVTGTLAQVSIPKRNPQTQQRAVERSWEATMIKPLFTRPGYDAEASHSPDGRLIVYTRVPDPEAEGVPAEEIGRPDPDIWILDTKTGKHHPTIVAEGYDGGPFFSPCGNFLCYRSDRRGDNRLQLFVAELEFDADGAPAGVKHEHQLTDDSHVHWAPYWHPSGKYLVYASSALGHYNYEVFAIEVALDKTPAEIRRRRITHATGADVLPVFSPDGKLMMWTAQRGPLAEGEGRPSSQLWIAEVVPGGLDDPEKLFEGEEAGITSSRVDKERAIEIARNELRSRTPGTHEYEFEARLGDDGWHIIAWRLPKTPGGHVFITVARDGRLLGYVPGR